MWILLWACGGPEPGTPPGVRPDDRPALVAVSSGPIPDPSVDAPGPESPDEEPDDTAEQVVPDDTAASLDLGAEARLVVIGAFDETDSLYYRGSRVEVETPGDLDLDGGADLIVRTHRGWVFSSRQTGVVEPSDAIQWSSGRLFAVGDQSGDHLPDLMIQFGVIVDGRAGRTLANAEPLFEVGGVTQDVHVVGDLTGDGAQELAWPPDDEAWWVVPGPFAGVIEPEPLVTIDRGWDAGEYNGDFERSWPNPAFDADADGMPDLWVTWRREDETGTTACREAITLGPLPPGALLDDESADLVHRSSASGSAPCGLMQPTADLTGDGYADLLASPGIAWSIDLHEGPFADTLGAPVASMTNRRDGGYLTRAAVLDRSEGYEILARAGRYWEATANDAVVRWAGPFEGTVDVVDLPLLLGHEQAHVGEDVVTGVGDVDRDGRTDVVISVDHELWLLTDW